MIKTRKITVLITCMYGCAEHIGRFPTPLPYTAAASKLTADDEFRLNFFSKLSVLIERYIIIS